MAPFAIIYIMNWIIFIIIFVSLLRKRHNINTVDKKDMKTRLRQQFIVALTLSLLFGLGWGMGFATTSSITSVPLSATLQAIFILLTGFQGLLIFIMHCVRCEEARDVWKEWLYIITCHKVEVGKLTSQSTAIFRLNNSGTHKPKAPPNGKQTLQAESDALEKEWQKELENGKQCVNESTFASSVLETVPDAEKKSSSPNEDAVNGRLLPHQESSIGEKGRDSRESAPPSLPVQYASPCMTSDTHTSPEEDCVNRTPLPDTSETVLPAMH